MSYVKFNGHNKKYVAGVMPFKTQHGFPAINIGCPELIDPPITSGFKYYDDYDKVVADYSDYIHHYEGNSYSMESDIIKPAKGVTTALPASPLAGIASELSRINVQTRQNTNEIQELTPYIETKTAYIDDTEIIFENVPAGNVLISAVNKEGYSVNALYSREESKVIVTFEPLEDVTNITLTVQ